MKKYLILSLIITISSLAVGQVNDVNDFIRFSKKEDYLQKAELGLKRWKTIQQETLNTENEIVTETSAYSKIVENGNYSLILEKSQSKNSNVVVYKTTVEIPNGRVFDNWTEGIENLGYNFVKVKDHNGRLATGEKNFMIIADLINIEQNSSQWKYQFSIITSKPKEKSEYPISQEELEKLKKEYNSTAFSKTPKVWLDEYYSQGWDDPNVKFSCKWTEDNYYTGIIHFKGKFCSYYGKDNKAIVWSGNIGPQKYEGLIEWTDERPITKGESMVQINLYTDSENYNFNTLILNMD